MDLERVPLQYQTSYSLIQNMKVLLNNNLKLVEVE